MAAKREQVVFKGVWDITKKYEYAYGLKPALSGAILAFDKLPPSEREAIVAEAVRLTEQAEAAETDEAAAAHKTEARKRRQGRRSSSKAC
jgi:hypothetical protein